MRKGLVAVSGGCDSLALLDMLYKKKECDVIVCHVNYNYRESAKRDEDYVVSYCDKRGIKYYILNLMSKDIKEGNFEDWARVKRYKFFKEIYEKENCDALFVGHQKEDVIETYLLQKNRNAVVETYGLAKKVVIQGMNVERIILSYTKKELEQYCLDNGITFGVDETNFDLSYSRNKIRHEIIAKMSEEEKDAIINEIDALNVEKQKRVEYVKRIKRECLVKDNVISLESFNKLSLEDKTEVLYYFIIDIVYKRISISKSRIQDILKKIDSPKPNIVLATYDDITLYKEYNFLVMEKNKEEYSYEIKDESRVYVGEGYYVSNQGKKLEKLMVSKDMFPLYLKNYKGDNKKVNRIFIDKKIPLRERKNWPIIVDKFDRLLLVIDIKKFYNELWDCKEDHIEFYISKNKGE